MKQNKLTKSARNQECTIRIPNVCNWNPETTVLCHLNGGGFGMKMPDYAAAYGCSSCHDAIDHRTRTSYTRLDLDLMHYEGVIRTQKIMVDLGLIEIHA